MFKCRIANIEEINRKWDYEIENHPNDLRWVTWKEIALNNVREGNRICFYGFLDGEIIGEATAIISQDDSGLECKELIQDNGCYLEAFRINKEYRGKGYFSKIYNFMENHLKNLGIKALVLGVEPKEEKNYQIYSHYGFSKFLFSKIEKYPPKTQGGESEEISVNYYLKEI